jgi:guanylate kinase
VSATTRKPREGERDGVDYHFLSDAEFDRRVVEGDFVEHAEYSGRRYGTLRSELAKRTAGGASVVLEIEVQGAHQVERVMPEAVRIFIAPPSEATLRERLEGRGTDNPEQIEARLAVAKAELAAAGGRRLPARRAQRPARGRGRRARARRPRSPLGDRRRSRREHGG